MRKYLNAVLAITLMTFMALTISCSKKQVKEDSLTAPAVNQPVDTSKKAEEPALEESVLGSNDFREIPDSQKELKAIFQDIHFDYDDFSLRPDAKKILNKIAEWMIQNTNAYILIEGNCDERGTIEYNLALGERRAKSAKKYLVQLGVSPKRISTISYGKERPLDPGHNEEAWAKNRRDHFLIR